MAGGGAKPGERRGGRKKGTPNKKTAEVKAKLEQIGASGLEGLARIAAWAENALYDAETLNDRIGCMALAGRMYTELAQYEAPKRKAIEGTPDKPVEMRIGWKE